MASLINTTLRAFDQMLERTGGSLHISDGNQDKTGIDNPLSGLRIPDGRKLFEVSIYNLETRTKEINLCLFVNPTDIQFGQVYLANNAYTRIGYVNTLWGQQQMTVTANGKSAAFYILADNNQGGITNYYRRNSVAFKNLFTLMAIFKNNGAHFLSSTSAQSIFKDGSSRVINVLDAVRIDYDGSSYLGAFNTFVVNDNADKPFTLEYNFEFVVSDLITDRATSPIEGHIRKGNNANVTEPSFATQGFNTRFDEVVKMNAEELNEHFNMRDRPVLKQYEYTDSERDLEFRLYNTEGQRAGYWDTPEGRSQVRKVPDQTISFTSGGLDQESHEGKADFRTASGNGNSFSDGRVVRVVTRGSGLGQENYIIIKTQVEVGDGTTKPGYVRFYHLDAATLPQYKEGDEIKAGDYVGREGTDGGRYPPHFDFKVTIENPSNPGWEGSTQIDATAYLEAGVQRLRARGFSDYQKVEYKHGKKSTQ